jgi:hypothetical protein
MSDLLCFFGQGQGQGQGQGFPTNNNALLQALASTSTHKELIFSKY